MRAAARARGVGAGRQGLAVDAHPLDRCRSSGEARQVTSPVSLVVTAFASLPDVRGTWTPQLRDGSALVLVDLGAGRDRLGGSIAGPGGRGVRRRGARPRRPAAPAVAGGGPGRAPFARSRCWRTTTARTVACGRPRARWRSPVRVGVELDVPSVAALFAEELGVVLGVPADALAAVEEVFAAHGLAELVSIGRPHGSRPAGARVAWRASRSLDESVRDLAQAWDEVSWRIAALRDNPACADEEHAAFGSDDDPGLVVAPVVRPDRRRRGALPHRSGCGRRSRSCASRASTATSRRHSPSTEPVSTPTTCT